MSAKQTKNQRFSIKKWLKESKKLIMAFFVLLTLNGLVGAQILTFSTSNIALAADTGATEGAPAAVKRAGLSLPSAANYGGAVQDPGTIASFESGFASLVVNLILTLRYVIGAIAIVGIVYGGFRLITAQGDEKALKNQQATILWSVVGLALIGLSGEIVRVIAVGNCVELGYLPSSNYSQCQTGGILKDSNAILARSTLFNRFVQYLIVFIKYVIGAMAVFNITYNAFRLISTQGDAELAKKYRTSVGVGVVGLIIIILADPLINNVLFKVDKGRYPGVGGVEAGIDLGQGLKELVGFTNLLVSILGPIAVLSIVAGGVMYATSGVNKDAAEKAKKIIQLSVVGFILIYGAFAIVSTFVSGQIDAGEALIPGNLPEAI